MSRPKINLFTGLLFLLPVHIEVSGDGDDFTVVKAGTLRTARKIMDGHVYY